MRIIESMPTYLGAQFYPGGCPIPADKISVNGRTIWEIFLDLAKGDFNYDNPDLKVLDNFYRYYLLAPCWDLGDITKEDIIAANGIRLFEICMDLGLDPL